jgi:hypothetical protein
VTTIFFTAEGYIVLFARRDGAMTALLSGVVLVLILCHTPKTIVNTYESYQVN